MIRRKTIGVIALLSACYGGSWTVEPTKHRDVGLIVVMAHMAQSDDGDRSLRVQLGNADTFYTADGDHVLYRLEGDERLSLNTGEALQATGQGYQFSYELSLEASAESELFRIDYWRGGTVVGTIIVRDAPLILSGVPESPVSSGQSIDLRWQPLEGAFVSVMGNSAECLEPVAEGGLDTGRVTITPRWSQDCDVSTAQFNVVVRREMPGSVVGFMPQSEVVTHQSKSFFLRIQ